MKNKRVFLINPSANTLRRRAVVAFLVRHGKFILGSIGVITIAIIFFQKVGP